jgi:hypothetical protein
MRAFLEFLVLWWIFVIVVSTAVIILNNTIWRRSKRNA